MQLIAEQALLRQRWRCLSDPAHRCTHDSLDAIAVVLLEAKLTYMSKAQPWRHPLKHGQPLRKPAVVVLCMAAQNSLV